MQMRKTSNGELISALGFGAMRLPLIDGKIDKTISTEMIYYAIDHGVNFIDTALLYHEGCSESFLGEILTDDYRDKVKLCTKVPAWSIEKIKDVEKYFESQLRKLQTDCIDYYLIHNLSWGSFLRLRELGILEFLESKRDIGKIKYIGFSFHDSKEAFKKIVDSYNWDACLIQLNFLDENSQAGTDGLHYAANQGITVLVMGPLKGGILAGEPPVEAKRIWESSPVKRTPVEWALRWVFNHSEVTCVLSGMGTLDEVKENINVVNETPPDILTLDELKLYRQVKQVYEDELKVNCTTCGYCLPCPQNVDIPQCFTLYNQKHMYNNKVPDYLYLTVLGGAMSDNPSYAGLCNECGKCIELCPQKINIPKSLKEVSIDMEEDFQVKIEAVGLRLKKRKKFLEQQDK
jgi:predicted aldo/keto reductase-like oxidoreductase